MSSLDKQFVCNRAAVAASRGRSYDDLPFKRATARRVISIEEKGDDPADAYTSEQLTWASTEIVERRIERAAELVAPKWHTPAPGYW